MLTKICPKLPMRDKSETKSYYENLGFVHFGRDFMDYLMMQKDEIEIHFFLYKDLDSLENYGQVYIRTNNIDEIYQTFLDQKVAIHPNGNLQTKPWGQKEFSLLDPNGNLLTFGENR